MTTTGEGLLRLAFGDLKVPLLPLPAAGTLLPTTDACAESLRGGLKAHDRLKLRFLQGHFNQQASIRRADRICAIAVGQLSGLTSSNYRDRALFYLSGMSLAAQVYDYFGRTPQAASCVSDGRFVFDALCRCNDLRRCEPVFLREAIRYCLEYALHYHYRRLQYVDAEAIILKSIEFLKVAATPKRPFHCTFAHAFYYLGKTKRRQDQYDESDECFLTTIEHYRQHAELYSDSSSHVRKGLDNHIISIKLAFSDYRSAMTGAMGLGWTNISRGCLTHALYNVQHAKICLVRRRDPINAAYVQLIDGIIKRAKAGRDIEQLKTAIDALQKAYATFIEYGQILGQLRANYELSKALFYAGEYGLARERAAAIIEVNEQSARPDSRWMSRAHTVMSRIKREEGALGDAEEAATLAKHYSAQINDRRGMIDALIALGETRISQDNFAAARGEFLTALNLNDEPGLRRPSENPNLKIRAVCSLHIARTYLATGDTPQAKQWLEGWNALQSEVEHTYVRDLANRVSELIRAGDNRDFLISAPKRTSVCDPHDFNYERHHNALRSWLARMAFEQTQTLKGTAEALGISRETLYQWKHSLGIAFRKTEE